MEIKKVPDDSTDAKIHIIYRNIQIQMDRVGGCMFLVGSDFKKLTSGKSLILELH